MYFEEEEALPTLIPINRKKTSPAPHSPDPDQNNKPSKAETINILQPKSANKDSKEEPKKSNER